MRYKKIIMVVVLLFISFTASAQSEPTTTPSLLGVTPNYLSDEKGVKIDGVASGQPDSQCTEDIEKRLINLSFRSYNVATVSIGTSVYQDVNVRNLIILRSSNKKTREEKGLPVVSSTGSFVVEGRSIKTDRSKKAYRVSYFAINGQDITEIDQNFITVSPNKNIYVLEIIDDNPRVDDSFFINSAMSHLTNESMPKETALSMGFAWAGQLKNEDFAVFTRKNYNSMFGLPNVGILTVSVYDKNKIEGEILGQVLFDGDRYIIEPSIHILDKDTYETTTINLGD